MSMLALAVALSLAATPVVAAGDLSPFRWDKRVLVISGPAADPQVAEQRHLLETQAEGLAERDMLVLHIDGDTVTALFGAAGAIDAEALRAKLDIAATGFTVLLVGKDGGTKLRETSPVPATQIFGLIDSMPMRQNEMHGG